MVLPVSDGISRVPPYSGTRTARTNRLRLRDFHPLWPDFPDRSALLLARVAGLPPRPSLPYNPGDTTPTGLTCHRFGLFPVRSPLLGESRLISFPGGTEMCHFPPFRLTRLWIQRAVTEGYSVGFPHSEIPGSSACLQLPGAYRSLPRPSSPTDAKASTVRP